ncbi:formylglycine-generating enzyme family protein [uncultured Treponema sp.]|uniref:formylglycine-generating enzyme family protein n=1 Tax=uncultured Treponema sp. TaxID=162155 RepID=UPI00258A93FE|nr:formylglycine-generating enzyme family protein [uncultured Treponema sp.]
MKLKFIFIVAMSALLSFMLAAEDNFEKLLEKYKNVTSESLLAEREKKQLAMIIDNTFLDGAMIVVPGENYSILKTEVTQEFYEFIMGENPSFFGGEKNLPVERVSWYDAIVFCNRLSVKEGLKPVYSVDGVTNVSMWDYTPHEGHSIHGEVKCNEKANGYRLPTVEEWVYAAEGGQEFKYSGSDNLDEVGWYDGNSVSNTHPVAQKVPNGYGLYDMSGNVWEWCWDSHGSKYRYSCGGGWSSNANYCGVGYGYWNYDNYASYCLSYGGDRYANYRDDYLGFRIVRNIDE